MRRGPLTFVFVVGLAWAATGVAAAPEAEVKAAVVFNLLSFVEWPAGAPAADRQLTLCTFEGGALEAALLSHEGKAVRGVGFAVRRAGVADDLHQCWAVFAEAGNPAALGRSAAAARTQPLLVIGEGAGALEQGAMIGIAVIGGRVAFDVDLAALRRARLSVSSKLLRLARTLVE